MPKFRCVTATVQDEHKQQINVLFGSYCTTLWIHHIHLSNTFTRSVGYKCFMYHTTFFITYHSV